MTSLSRMMEISEGKKHLQCIVKGCPKNRTGLNPMCAGHTVRLSRYGHVDGRPYPRTEYKRELEDVRGFFKDHEGHPAIQSATHFLQQWMEEAGRKEAKAGQRVFGRLYHHGISATDILIEVMAVWLYSDRHPHALIDDQRLTYALARNAARLAKFEQRTYGSNRRMLHPRPAELKESGERIRGALARFFINLNHALKAKEESAKAIQQHLSTPFI